MRLEAGDGLTLHLDENASWCVAWGVPDWLGPLGLSVRHAGERWGVAAEVGARGWAHLRLASS